MIGKHFSTQLPASLKMDTRKNASFYKTRRNIFTIARIWQLILLICLPLLASASVPPEEFYKDLTTIHFAVDSSLTVRDDKFLSAQWSTIEKNISVQNAIVFDINDDTTIIYKYPFTCTINVKILWWDSSNTSHLLFKNLSIDYDTGKVKQYAARNTFYMKNAYKMKVTIASINFVQSGWNGVLPRTLRLSGLISIDRKYKFKCAQRTYPKAQIQASKNTLKISWKAVDGAEEYDLDWTYYHDSSALVKKYKGSPNTVFHNYDSLYRNNASRVTTLQNIYYIPMSYPEGYLFFRVRSVHYTTNGFRKTSQWSGQDTSAKFSQFKYKIHLSGMDTLVNWQATVTYAEEGKRSPVVTYFDGSLRNRQTVTVSDAVGRAIVGETFYDHQGRPSVQTLPVPAKDVLLGFHNMFNIKNGTNTEYNRDDFDVYGCGYSPPQMDSSLGSSYYYSQNNPEFYKSIQKFIPTADGYPFTIKRYTPDLTGRVSIEANAGKELRLGNGHETKYYYSKPSQEELDRLFGNDAGYDSLYFKNMVVDPNGQISVSYLDGSGHTIATALAGVSPSNLETLPSNTGPTNITIDLLTSSSKDGSGLNMDYTLLVEMAETHHFNYNLVPASFTPDCRDNANICFDCLYDLTITVTDVCNNSSLPNGVEFRHVLHNYSPGAIYDSLCSNPVASITDTFSLALGVGEYHISKQLTVSEAGKQQYTNSYIVHDSCLKSYNTFFHQAVGNIDFAGCYMNCTECLNSIGTSSSFLHNYITNLGYPPTHQDTLDANTLYANAGMSCTKLCDTVSNECDIIYQELRNDVIPGGQYAKYKYDTFLHQYVTADTSLLNSNPNMNQFFGYLDYTKVVYKKANNTPDTVWIDNIPYLPSQLSVDLFIAHWQDSWADALVPLHPEYCYYTYCHNNSPTFQYATDMLNTSTYGDAVNKGYLNPLGKSLTDLDTRVYCGGNPQSAYYPYNLLDIFFFGPGASSTSEMNDSMHLVKVNGGLSIFTDWEIASASAICSTCNISHLPCFTDSCVADADMAWIAFRSIYLGERKKFVDRLFQQQNSSCYGSMLLIGKSGIFKNMSRKVYFYQDVVDSTSDPDATENSIVSNCESNCAAMADNWIQILKADSNCNLSTADSISIRQGLIEVCQTGCDNNHPFGATSLPFGVTSFPHSYTSFQDVLDNVLGANTPCSATAINFPPAYQANDQVPQVFFGDYDTCVCHRMNAIHDHEYDSIGSGYTFAHFLSLYYESNLTETQVYQILGICNGNCSWLPEPIPLPDKLTCGNCAHCAEVVDDFNYSSSYNTDTNVIASQMNSLYGFNLTYTEYYNFKTVCQQHIYNLESKSYYTDSIELCLNDTVHIYSDTVSCFDQLMNLAAATATQNYQLYMDSVKSSWWDQYKQHCLDAAQETFTAIKPYDQYHFTLYYYDQAGNLVQTVPPKGVHPLTSVGDLNAVKNHRLQPNGNPPKFPLDSLMTRYWYNTLNQPVKQWTPDGDSTRFWYDRLGRMVVSQNGKQRPLTQYSYTLYDALGRITEVGQLKQTTVLTFATALNDALLKNWLSAGANKKEVTHTYYEKAAFAIPNLLQENLRNRVASVTFMQSYNTDSTQYDFATHYSYDIAGNVKVLEQENKKLTANKNRYKRIDYDYDLISGKVNKVYYQKDSLDQFTHWYIYDEDNRLLIVKTLTDNLLHYASMDASYLYYKHGPLARLEIGTRQVQGIDYAYTLQGWMKGMNSDLQTSQYDMGQDGLLFQHRFFGKDVVGFTLNYFDRDYHPIGPSIFEMSTSSSGGFGLASPSLFNGNIRRAVYALHGLADSTIGYSYKYDQLNRLTRMDAWNNYTPSSFSWNSSGSALNKFRERIKYDPNGNILSYIRRGDSPLPMDSLTYFYTLNTNQLKYVKDGVNASNYTSDIDNQSSNNYSYDALGNLTKDNAEEIPLIKWTVSGKIDSIARSAGSTKDKLKFYYDVSGNRVGKIDYKSSGAVIKTWYVRDAQGNIMATYTQSHDTITWSEQEIYGSARIGNWLPNKRMYPNVSLITTDSFHLKFYAGDKRYELTNHLGNVMAVITDRKLGIDIDSNSKADFYLADVAGIQDYYPFGALEPGRSFNAGNYRFGFDGQEKDDEVKGSGNSLSFDFRIYDSRLGKFLSVDPLTSSYPGWSPYAFAQDRVIDGIDLEGLEYISQSDPNINSTQQNTDGTCSINIGDQTMTSDGTVDYNGQQYYNIGQNLFCTSSGIAKTGSDAQKITTFFVTQDQLCGMFPNSGRDVLNSLGNELNSYMGQYGIDTYTELAHFLAQAGVETGGFTSLNATENLNYTKQNVCDIIAPSNHSVDNNPWPYVGNPVAVGNLRYGGGYSYRGRGVLQLTHLENYRRFQNHYNKKYSPKINVVQSPDLVASDPHLAVLSGLDYFNYRVMKPFGAYKSAVDLSGTLNSTVDKVTLRINGGYMQRMERRQLFHKALDILY